MTTIGSNPDTDTVDIVTLARYESDMLSIALKGVELITKNHSCSTNIGDQSDRAGDLATTSARACVTSSPGEREAQANSECARPVPAFELLLSEGEHDHVRDPDGRRIRCT
jgi:hypothetical protein